MKKIISLILVTALLTGLSASAVAVDFPDVADEYWAAADIQLAADYGLVQGLSDGTFAPHNTLDRAAFLTILQRMFQWEAVTPETPTFRDVAPDAWYYTAVETAAAQGILDDVDTLHPQGYITRGEMAVLLVRSLGYEQLASDIAGKEPPFPDVVDYPGHIAIAAAIGMTQGIQNPETGALEFQPDAFATRDQAATMLVRVYQRYVADLTWRNGFYAFASYSQIDLTHHLDTVALGWAQLTFDDGELLLNQTNSNKNPWVIPDGADKLLTQFDDQSLPYTLSVYMDTGHGLNDLLDDPEAQANAIAQLVAAAQAYHGLTIDFEALRTDKKEAFTAFMTQLRASLPADKTLQVCVPPNTWYGGYDFRQLGDLCHKVIYMAHDYQWSTIPSYYVGRTMDVRGEMSTPVTPFPLIFRDLQAITHAETGVQDVTKIALQISFGSAGVEVDANNILQSTQIYRPAPDVLYQRLQQEGTVVNYDDSTRNPVATYFGDDGETRYMVWYEDAQSVQDKLDLARMFGITAVSFWRLGTIPNQAGYDVVPLFS